MAEDSVEGEFDKMIILTEKRKEAEKPSQEQINLVMQKKWPSLKSDIMCIFGEESEILKYFRQCKSGMEKNVRKRMSRPLLCATILNRHLTDWSIDEARVADSKGNKEKFIFLFDFAIGSQLVLTSIIRAEDELSDRGEDQRLQVSSYMNKTPNKPTSKMTKEYLYMKREDDGLLRLLLKDPSGFLLVDSLVKRAETDTALLDFCVKEYLLAGAETAGDLYKKFYKIAAPLYLEKPSK